LSGLMAVRKYKLAFSDSHTFLEALAA